MEQKRLQQLLQRTPLSDGELTQILSSGKRILHKKEYHHSRIGHYRFGVISDTHIGHEKFDEGLFDYAYKIFKTQGISTVYHVGDILDGMSGRDGHIFELSEIGFSRQIKKATRLFQSWRGIDIYGITGNHDDWYKKRNNGGIIVGEELENRCSNFHFIGEYEADVRLGPKTVMKLFHPADGSAYATSYKLQKLIESLEAGTKPNILFEGHYHKALYMFLRNVHAFESGTLCGQTGWMRGNKIAAHKGFWVVDIKTSKRGIESLSPTFYPAYD